MQTNSVDQLLQFQQTESITAESHGYILKREQHGINIFKNSEKCPRFVIKLVQQIVLHKV